MQWKEIYPQSNQPALKQISAHIGNVLWTELLTFIEQTYHLSAQVEYSKCSCSPGWNVKFKKGSRALCTLYPASGMFTCLLSIGAKEAQEAELVLAGCGRHLQELYWQVKPFNGARWLMIDVDSKEMLEDLEKLLCVRMKPVSSKQ